MARRMRRCSAIRSNVSSGAAVTTTAGTASAGAAAVVTSDRRESLDDISSSNVLMTPEASCNAAECRYKIPCSLRCLPGVG